jgi:hypothetical protein
VELDGFLPRLALGQQMNVLLAVESAVGNLTGMVATLKAVADEEPACVAPLAGPQRARGDSACRHRYERLGRRARRLGEKAKKAVAQRQKGWVDYSAGRAADIESP